MLRIIIVEDSYGIGFHREIIGKLKKEGYLDNSFNPRIERLDTGKCNPKLRRSIYSRYMDSEALKILFVIDSEGRANAAHEDITRHFNGRAPLREKVLSIDVVAVDPRHEAWLCIGLGGDPKKCRQTPEYTISRIKKKQYDWKGYLAEWANDIKIDYLLNENDFKTYVKKLTQLEK